MSNLVANQPLAKRSVEVLYRINILKESMMDNFFEIGERTFGGCHGALHAAVCCDERSPRRVPRR